MLSGLAGLVAGLLHVVSGPDHLAAVAPLAAHARDGGWRTGATWGLGHGSGVVVLGGVGIAARQALSLERLAGVAELLVGFLLVGVGLWAVRRALRLVVHEHGHDHDALGHHHHLHVHVGAHIHLPRIHERHTHALLGIGFLHGAAGGGHLFGVLPSLALPPAEAALYLLSYLVAAVAAMATFGRVVGGLTRRGGPKRLRAMMVGSGGLAMAIGVVWIASAWPAAL